jgi:hypothetical protein
MGMRLPISLFRRLTTTTEGLALLVAFVLSLNVIRLIYGRPGNASSNTDFPLSISPISFDFKNVKQGEKVPFAITLKNVSNEAISSIEVKTSCGCTVIDKGPPALNAGDSIIMRGEYNSIGRRGPFASNVLVSYQADSQTLHRVIQLNAYVKPTVIAKPPHLDFSLKDASGDSIVSKSVVFRTDDARHFDIERITCWHPAFTIREKTAAECSPAERKNSQANIHAVEVLFDPTQWKALTISEKYPLSFRVRTTVDTEPDIAVPITVK